jgi:NADH-quinone oxidoreductase subunit I
MSEYFTTLIDGAKTFLIGMKMTLKHFNNKEELVATLQYPHEKWPIPERNIGFENSEYNLIRSRLHVDIEDCIGCLQCEKVCPVDCIKIDTVKAPKGTEADYGITSNDTEKKMLVTRFSIDMSECMYCNLCEYPCPEECIYMVGGPNEQKHEIDYEFSEYVRSGLVYEFAFPTDEKILKVGGKDYLKKKADQKVKMEEGSQLAGLVEEDQKVQVSETAMDEKKTKKVVETGLTLKVFNQVPDKVSRGVAKKAFQAAKRAKMDYSTMADYVNDAIEKAGKSSDEMSQAIKQVRNYKDETVSVSEVNVKKEEVVQDQISETTASTDEFDIKSLNVIDDKMARGIAKKAFTAAKREGLDSNGKVSKVKAALEDSGKLTADITSLLDSFTTSASVNDLGTEDEISSQEVITDELFDLKLLNVIDDKVARGTAKKIYMAGKRNGKNSADVINDIRSQLGESGHLNDDVESILNGIGK